ncbi:unnamed protein product [Mytilus coruscus]|uniref:CCHC-type domain-containing protein n=1 Tax=Mytilus coruscus TaxID=42192 RepID=A0A6J8DL10_MYTCO|nr:unnamed protein product [Mytilus coruscus]
MSDMEEETLDLAGEQDTTHTLEKKVIKAEHSFKFKGHQVQYELNVDLQDLVQRALAYLGRNKSEKASEGGWKTVQEYLSDDLASDSEDEKKIRAADNRAVKKLKSVKSADKKQNVRKRPAEASGSTSQTAHNAIPVSVSMPLFRGSRPGYGNQVKRSREGDMCYRCGLFGHWASECKKDTKTGFGAPRGTS